MSGYTMTQTELLYALPASVTKNNYTTQAILSGLASGTQPTAIIPAGYWGSAVPNALGRSIFAQGFLTIANVSAATFALAFGLDPTPGTLANATTIFPATAPLASTTTIIHVEIYMNCTQAGGTATVQYNTVVTLTDLASGSSSTLGSATGQPAVAYTQGTIASLNGNALLELSLAGTWSSGSASNTTTLNHFNVWGLN